MKLIFQKVVRKIEIKNLSLCDLQVSVQMMSCHFSLLVMRPLLVRSTACCHVGWPVMRPLLVRSTACCHVGWPVTNPLRAQSTAYSESYHIEHSTRAAQMTSKTHSCQGRSRSPSERGHLRSPRGHSCWRLIGGWELLM